MASMCRPQYLLVYRSPMAEKLFWGLDDADNTMLKLATVKANLTEFPAGCAFEVSRAWASADFVIGDVGVGHLPSVSSDTPFLAGAMS